MINLREISFAVIHNTQCQVFLVYNQEKLKKKTVVINISLNFWPLKFLLSMFELPVLDPSLGMINFASIKSRKNEVDEL